MKIIADEHCCGYSRPGHPERPARVTHSMEKLRAQTDVPITWIAPRPAGQDLCARIHPNSSPD